VNVCVEKSKCLFARPGWPLTSVGEKKMQVILEKQNGSSFEFDQADNMMLDDEEFDAFCEVIDFAFNCGDFNASYVRHANGVVEQYV
jgi:hypothetical protein